MHRRRGEATVFSPRVLEFFNNGHDCSSVVLQWTVLAQASKAFFLKKYSTSKYSKGKRKKKKKQEKLQKKTSSTSWVLLRGIGIFFFFSVIMLNYLNSIVKTYIYKKQTETSPTWSGTNPSF